MPPPNEDLRRAAHSAVSVAFGSLGRVCLALDDRLQILEAAGAVDSLLGPGAAAAWVGHPVEALLGHELIGPTRPLREALLAGERREGWRIWLPVAPSGTRRCAGSAAPLLREPGDGCPPGAAYLVVLRLADEAALHEPPSSGAPSGRPGAAERWEAAAAGPGATPQKAPDPTDGSLRPRGAPPPREAIAAALEANRWRMAQAARALGISRTTLWRWMRELGLAR